MTVAIATAHSLMLTTEPIGFDNQACRKAIDQRAGSCHLIIVLSSPETPQRPDTLVN
jgi:hypothetical protein